MCLGGQGEGLPHIKGPLHVLHEGKNPEREWTEKGKLLAEHTMVSSIKGSQTEWPLCGFAHGGGGGGGESKSLCRRKPN